MLCSAALLLCPLRSVLRPSSQLKWPPLLQWLLAVGTLSAVAPGEGSSFVVALGGMAGCTTGKETSPSGRWCKEVLALPAGTIPGLGGP